MGLASDEPSTNARLALTSRSIGAGSIGVNPWPFNFNATATSVAARPVAIHSLEFAP